MCNNTLIFVMSSTDCEGKSTENKFLTVHIVGQVSPLITKHCLLHEQHLAFERAF